MEDEILIKFMFKHNQTGAILLMDGIDLNNAEECIHDIVEDSSEWTNIDL